MSETLDYVWRIHQADRSVLDEIEKSLPAIAAAADALAERLRRGGRLLYVGAGTSGRLAVVDAAELSPTFGFDSDRVIALIAGGERALRTGIETVEDDAGAAARDLKKARVGADDAVVAIAASGTTPYARGALQYAREKGALTVALVCNPGTPLAEAADLAIQLHTGAEVVSGSTRMKAGTAQKMVLTMLSTAVMRSLGRIYRDEMVAMRPTNTKLRARAARILSDLTGLEKAEAQQLLESSEWDLPVSLVRARLGVDAGEARTRLEQAGGSVAEALREADAAAAAQAAAEPEPGAEAAPPETAG